MKKTLLTLLISLNLNAHANTYTVTNTDDHGVGSLRQAVIDSNNHTGNDTIKVSSAIANGTISLFGEMEVTDSLTIDGNNLTVNANEASRIFYATKTLTIKNMTLTNGNGHGDEQRLAGGAIYSTAPITIKHSNISKNSATIGAGIYSLSSVKIIDSNFDNNKARGSGGAILVKGGITIKNSTFSQNFSVNSGGGGAIRVDRTLTNIETPIRISNSTFNNNHASTRGGVLYFNLQVEDNVTNTKVKTSVTINNSIFKHNSSGYSGGAINIGVNNEIENKIGAVSTNVPIIITNSIFEHNTTDSQGGAICIIGTATSETDYSYVTTDVPVKVKNSTFNNNNAIRGGGAIYTSTYTRSLADIEGKATTKLPLTITNSTISNNITAEVGGAIYADTTVRDYNLREVKPYGENSITLVNSTLSQNKANNHGGSIYLKFESPNRHIANQTITVKNSILLGNQANNQTNTCEVSTKTNKSKVIDLGNNLLDSECLGRKSTIAVTSGVTVGNTLETLADNNCVTKSGNTANATCVTTHALRAGSVAIDSATSGSLTKDQRGFSRDATPDVGAFEVTNPVDSPTKSIFADSFE